MSVQLHSVTLLKISDHVTRSSNTNFGILVGTTDGEIVTVFGSYEILLKPDAEIDWIFLEKRMAQFNTVYPQYSVVGFYQLAKSLDPSTETYTVLDQLQSYMKKDLVFTIFDISELENATDQSYEGCFRSYRHGTVLHTTICTSESEYIATTTVVNHRKYYSNLSDDNSHDVSLKAHNENIAGSTFQLHDKLLKILEYVSRGEKNDEVGRRLNHLANKIANYKDVLSPDAYVNRLQTSNLSLLTDQLAALEGLKSLIARNVIKDGISNNNQQKQFLGRLDL